VKADALAQDREQTKMCEKVSLCNSECETATFGFPKIYPTKRFANYAFENLDIKQTTNQALSRAEAQPE